MRTYKEYLKELGLADASPDNKSEASIDVIQRVLKLGWQKYPYQIKRFFDKLGENDPEIRMELKKVRDDHYGDGPVNMDKEKKDMDDVVPPSADANHGGE
jgi:hypothetical protein